MKRGAHAHDGGQVMQAVICRVLPIHQGEQTGGTDRADILRGSLQTGREADF
jgi:hypothetical protein